MSKLEKRLSFLEEFMVTSTKSARKKDARFAPQEESSDDDDSDDDDSDAMSIDSVDAECL